MSGGTYQIIVVAVAAFALIRGFQKGFTGQVCSILGMAFGAVCSIVFQAEGVEILSQIIPSMVSFPFPPFLYGILASSIIYFVVYYSVKYLTRIFRKLMKVLHVSMLDRLFGSAFCMLKYLLVLSIIYNLILCVDPESPLLKYAEADDGNMVQSVLLLAPGVLGCLDAEDLNHALQLIEAKKISCNFHDSRFVINIDPRGEFYKEEEQC